MRTTKMILAILMAGFLLASCNYNHTLIYTETQCSDAWQHDDNNIVYTNNIQAYLLAHGVNTGSIEIMTPDTPNGIFYCQACQCPTGRTVKITVADDDVAEANGLGFH